MAMGASGVDSQIILGGSGFFGVGGEYLERNATDKVHFEL